MSAVRPTTSSAGFLQSTNVIAHSIGTGDFTLMGWHKKTLDGSGNEGCCCFADDGFVHFTIQTGSGAAITWRHTQQNGTTRVFAQTTDADSIWKHLCIVRVSGTLKGYLSSVLDANTFSESENVADAKGTLIGSTNTGSNPSVGLYLDWALWNVALSESEIKSVYNTRSLIQTLVASGRIATTPVVGWKMDQTSGVITNGDSGLADWVGTNHLVTGSGGEMIWSGDTPIISGRDPSGRPSHSAHLSFAPTTTARTSSTAVRIW